MARTLKTFSEMLGLLSRGRFTEKLDEEMRETIAHLEGLPNEKGKATITVSFQLSYQSGRLDIKPECKVKLPEGQGFTETPFWTVEGELSVQHPSQSDMFAAREVSARERDEQTA